jgi:pilus assembly protein Flp/PilA
MNQLSFFRRCVEFLQEEDGPTAVEYAVMLALIVAVCAGTVSTLSDATKASFDASKDAIANAGGN